MNSKLRKVLVGVTAAAVLAGGALTASSASAHQWPQGNQWQQRSHYYGNHRYWGNHGYYGGWGYDNGLGLGILGFMAGAAVGTAISQSDDPNSCYRFRTYNPHTGMYMSNHGPRHCP